MPELFPLQLLLTTFSGWVNRERAQVVAYLVEENRVVKEQLGGRRLRLTDDQRRRLAAKGKVLGRRLLHRVATIVTPDTILRWHQRLIAAKWTHPTKRIGRPGIMKAIRELIVRMATDNSNWGYCRIQGELKKLGHRVARSTIANTLKDNGIRPAPERPTSWRTFLKSHAEVIAATDFFTTEVWTARGLITHYVLFIIHHASRAVEIAGITTNPDSAFMAQVARNLTADDDGFLRGKRFLILDGDKKFTAQFCAILEEAGVQVVRTAFQAPNMNAIAERWVKSVKTECLDRLILFGQGHLERALREYVAHHHTERPHQGLGNELIAAPLTTATGDVVVHERLGGLLNSYRRSAAPSLRGLTAKPLRKPETRSRPATHPYTSADTRSIRSNRFLAGFTSADFSDTTTAPSPHVTAIYTHPRTNHRPRAVDPGGDASSGFHQHWQSGRDALRNRREFEESLDRCLPAECDALAQGGAAV